MLSLPGRHEQEEAHHDLVLLELLRRRSRRGRARSSDRRSDSRGARRSARRQRSKISGMSLSIAPSIPSGLRSASPAPSVEFISLAQIASSSSGMPMKLPITRETTGWATSVTRSQRLAALEPVEHPCTISRIACSWAAIRFGVKPAWNSAFSAVVLRRVHADEHRLHELEREHRRDRRDAAEFRGVGLPVSADRMDVVGGRDRPEARLLGEFVEALGPVDRAVGAQLLEHRIWRPIAPQLFVAEFDCLQVALNRRHRDLRDRISEGLMLLAVNHPAPAGKQARRRESPRRAEPSRPSSRPGRCRRIRERAWSLR